MKKGVRVVVVALFAMVPVIAFGKVLHGTLQKARVGGQIKSWCRVELEGGTHQDLPCSWSYVDCSTDNAADRNCSATVNRVSGGRPDVIVLKSKARVKRDAGELSGR